MCCGARDAVGFTGPWCSTGNVCCRFVDVNVCLIQQNVCGQHSLVTLLDGTTLDAPCGGGWVLMVQTVLAVHITER